ncbi:hypothetical protein ACXN5S_05065 [Pseudoroseicyclus sp. H15]
MPAQIIAWLILVPFTLVFLYAGIHEYLRHKSDGKANYGLNYDEETGTTFVTGIAEHEEAYQIEDYDPASYKDPTFAGASDDSESGEANGGSEDSAEDASEDRRASAATREA